MPERIPRSPKPRRVSSRRRIQLPKPRIRRRKPPDTLTRSLSEPCLWNKIQFLPSSSSSSSSSCFRIDDDDVEFNKHAPLLRPHTFTDGGFFSSAPVLPFPSPLRPNFMELQRSTMQEAKVVVNVTVEGSPGPVRAMIKLGATVDEAIGVVIDRYKREGRSPKLALDAKSFRLHHSHFSLQSLSRSDRIGEVGSRSFYLRKGGEGRDSTSESEIELLSDNRLQTPSPSPTHIFFSFIARRLSKIKRRTKRLWRVVACISCV